MNMTLLCNHSNATNKLDQIGSCDRSSEYDYDLRGTGV